MRCPPTIPPAKRGCGVVIPHRRRPRSRGVSARRSRARRDTNRHARGAAWCPRWDAGAASARTDLWQLPAAQVCITSRYVKGEAPRRGGRGRVRITRGLCAGGAPDKIARSAFRISPARSGREPAELARCGAASAEPTAPITPPPGPRAPARRSRFPRWPWAGGGTRYERVSAFRIPPPAPADDRDSRASGW